jgi:hypothetical protein
MDRVNRNIFALLIGVGSILGACSMTEGDFPSLSKRPYENADPIAEPPSTATSLSTALPDSLRDSLSALTARHEAAEAAFRGALPAVRQVAQSAAGSIPGSEGWVNAQMELSRLEKKRADSLAALAEIDRLVSARRDKGADDGLTALMAPYQERVRREVEAQTDILVELTNLIG